MEYKTILTDFGLAKQISCLADKSKFDIQYIAVGDANGIEYSPEESQTALRNEVWRGSITSTGISEDGSLACTTSIPNETGGFTVREIGIFNKAGKLICIGNIPPAYKSVGTSSVTDILNIKISMKIINSLLTDLIISPETNLAANIDLSNLSEQGLSIIGTVFFEITGEAPDYFDFKKLGYDYEVISEY